jgi:spermidine synthase
MKLTNLLSGTRILEETTSKYNGKITVVRDFTWGTYIVVNNLTQSGGILFEVWQSTLRGLFKTKPDIKNCLILGLGGGSVGGIVHKIYPKAAITGVDIDKKMVELGKKYLGLSKINIDTRIADAYEFVQKEKTKFDLILIDLYCGDKFPQKFENEEFLKSIKNLVNKDGMVVFNRLYRGDERLLVMKFGKRLEKIFTKVEYFYPQANLELICYN